jgi:chromatin structure-remodeling complex subunit RSC1/2
VKIKNWNSCIPEEVRKSTEFMPIYPFEQTVFPTRLPSPFLTKGSRATIKGPGGIIDAVDKSEGERVDGEGASRKRTRRDAGSNKAPAGLQGTNAAAASSSYHYQPSHLSQQLQPHIQPSDNTDRSFVTAAGGMATLENNVQMVRLPPETSE